MTSSFIHRHVEKARQGYQPLFSTIELTHRCNFVCKHCYNFDREESKVGPYGHQTLSDESILNVINQLADAGSLYLNLTGGEPLLHPSLEKFVREAKKRSFYIRLKSNLSLLTHDKARSLFDAGLDALDVSLYGATDETYQRFTGRSFFDNVIKGFDAALEFDFDTTVSIILHRGNVHEIDEMISFCERRNLHYLFSDEITDRYDGSKAQQHHSMSDEQFAGLLNREKPYAESFHCTNKEKEVRCSCAQTVCGIAANGDVYPCIGAPIKSGNIQERSFQEIWQNSPELNRIRLLGKEDFKSCQGCAYIESCSRSSGSAYINTGDYTGCDPLAFKRAKVRHNFKR